ncbi:MAG: hypothetical protein ACR2NO_01535 [Chloroflexota bacterium]
MEPAAPAEARSATATGQVVPGEFETASAPTDPLKSPALELDGAPEAEPIQRERELRFWLRPLVMSGLVLALLALTWWDSRRVPTRPAPPTVQTATPPAGATVSTTDPALMDTLTRLRQALGRRDARALANLADPSGIIVAGYGGGLPENGYIEADALRLAQAALTGGNLSILGWRTDARGQVIVLTDGWQRKPLRMSGNSTLELTSLSAVGLTLRNGVWYWRWMLPDSTGALTQQARGAVWQALDGRN